MRTWIWVKDNQSQILLFVVVIALYLLFGGLLWWLLGKYVNPSDIQNAAKQATAKKDLLQALGLIMAGLAGAIGIFFTWRGQRLTQQTQEVNQRNVREQLEQARTELEITRRGQITERFTRAIDQLGSQGQEINLGGIYSLERTAWEDQDYYWPIMEVLTAYVRRHAPCPPEEPQEVEDEAAAEKKSEEVSGGESENAEGSAPAPAIQAIMTVLRRRTRSLGQGEPEPLDLRNTRLSGARLQEADLSGADLSAADLSGAGLRGAKLSPANLSEAVLSKADLSGANLSYARLVGANLSETQLSKANLFAAELAADFSEADLSEANLLLADFSLADLTGAKNLIQSQLEMTIGDEDHTRLPTHLSLPTHWSAPNSNKQTEQILTKFGSHENVRQIVSEFLNQLGELGPHEQSRQIMNDLRELGTDGSRAEE